MTNVPILTTLKTTENLLKIKDNLWFFSFSGVLNENICQKWVKCVSTLFYVGRTLPEAKYVSKVCYSSELNHYGKKSLKNYKKVNPVAEITQLNTEIRSLWVWFSRLIIFLFYCLSISRFDSWLEILNFAACVICQLSSLQF